MASSSSSSSSPSSSSSSSSSSAFVDVSKDPAIKRKRANQSAKLKQCKLEARREQWLSYRVSSIAKEFPRNGERGDPNVNNLECKYPPSNHDSVSSLTHKKECLQHVEHGKDIETDPGESRLVSNCGLEHGNESSQDAEHESIVNDPGEVIHPRYPEPSSEPYLCHFHSGDSEKDAHLVDIDPKSCSFPRMKASEKRRGVMRRRNVPGTSNVRKSQFSNWEKTEEEETSTKSGGGGTITKNELRKVDGGSRADKIDRTALSRKKTRKGRFSRTIFLNGTSGRKDTVDGHAGGCINPDDGWEEVADALGLPYNCEKINKPEFLNVEEGLSTSTVVRSTAKIETLSGRAWTQDDVFRPPCLPSLKKLQSLSPHSHNVSQWTRSNKKTQSDILDPSPCPICTEDLDSTDSSFDPCPCGFRLCLFCYHRIASDDGRCPGCRQTYNRELTSFIH